MQHIPPKIQMSDSSDGYLWPQACDSTENAVPETMSEKYLEFPALCFSLLAGDFNRFWLLTYFFSLSFLSVQKLEKHLPKQISRQRLTYWTPFIFIWEAKTRGPVTLDWDPCVSCHNYFLAFPGMGKTCAGSVYSSGRKLSSCSRLLDMMLMNIKRHK